MEEMGLPDELYIKMNSRGKSLTDFEYFKVRFTELLNVSHKEDFSKKIDNEWYDLFWKLEKENSGDIAQKVDEATLRYFRFITDILCIKDQIDINENADDFERFEKVYSNEDNVTFLFNSLDQFAVLYNKRLDFFSTIFYIGESKSEQNKNATLCWRSYVKTMVSS